MSKEEELQATLDALEGMGLIHGRDVFHFRAVCSMIARRVIRSQSEMPDDVAAEMLSPGAMADTGDPLSTLAGVVLHSDGIEVPGRAASEARPGFHATSAAGRNAAAEGGAEAGEVTGTEAGGRGELVTKPTKGKRRGGSKARARDVLNRTTRTIV